MPHAHPSGFPSPSLAHSNVRGGLSPALRGNQDQEVSPTGHRLHRDQEVSPTGETESFGKLNASTIGEIWYSCWIILEILHQISIFFLFML